MRDEERPWSERFRPRTLREVVDNREALRRFLAWVRSWRGGPPRRRSAFLYGPPGVGKTSAVEAVANDLGFDLIEVNASDYRTAKRIETILGRASSQIRTLFGRRRMILFDEVEGLSGQEDRGGVGAILSLIRGTASPIVLVATGSPEMWEDRLSPLMRVSELIEFRPIPFQDVVERLREICREVGVEAEEEALELIAERSNGDLRSAVNDLEAVARGRGTLTWEDVYWLGDRDRKGEISEVLRGIFSSKSFDEAREVLRESPIRYEELLEWIYENLPYFYDDPQDLAEAMDALSRADIYERRARETQEYRLLKYMFDAMVAEVALARKGSRGRGLIQEVRRALLSLGLPPSDLLIREGREGVIVKPTRWMGKDWQPLNSLLRELGGRWIREEGCWVVPYFRPPGRIRHLRRSWWSRRRLEDLARRVGEKCHVSTRTALREFIPYIRAIFKENRRLGVSIARWLELEEDTIRWLMEG
ncbi:replication factor C large subunit [Candidatus Bathyarchaeota archaeon]|nr:MAG: replication factor C large subunit [Candidatus Bathyarchaeota archaeon]